MPGPHEELLHTGELVERVCSWPWPALDLGVTNREVSQC